MELKGHVERYIMQRLIHEEGNRNASGPEGVSLSPASIWDSSTECFHADNALI